MEARIVSIIDRKKKTKWNNEKWVWNRKIKSLSFALRMEYIEEINNKLINWMITVALAIDRAMCVRQPRQTYCFHDGEKIRVDAHSHTSQCGARRWKFQYMRKSINGFLFVLFPICKIVFACRMRRLDPRTLPIVYLVYIPPHNQFAVWCSRHACELIVWLNYCVISLYAKLVVNLTVSMVWSICCMEQNIQIMRMLDNQSAFASTLEFNSKRECRQGRGTTYVQRGAKRVSAFWCN